MNLQHWPFWSLEKTKFHLKPLGVYECEASSMNCTVSAMNDDYSMDVESASRNHSSDRNLYPSSFERAPGRRRLCRMRIVVLESGRSLSCVGRRLIKWRSSLFGKKIVQGLSPECSAGMIIFCDSERSKAIDSCDFGSPVMRPEETYTLRR